jgi:hypothetical protein
MACYGDSFTLLLLFLLYFFSMCVRMYVYVILQSTHNQILRL